MRFEVARCDEAGPFDFRWWGPGAVPEHFDRSWTCEAVQEGRLRHLRHGIGRRLAYGRDRVHSVTARRPAGGRRRRGRRLWVLPGPPERAQAPRPKLARRRENLPQAYERFPHRRPSGGDRRAVQPPCLAVANRWSHLADKRQLRPNSAIYANRSRPVKWWTLSHRILLQAIAASSSLGVSPPSSASTRAIDPALK